MENIIYDVLKPEYISGIAEIEKLCFATPWSENQITAEIDNPLTVYSVAVFNGKVIAYGGYWSVAGDAQITNIAVHPDFQGKKIASQILENLLNTAKNRGELQLTLEVRESNTKAINLYKKYEFQTVGMRKNYYEGKENAILMTKIIN